MYVNALSVSLPLHQKSVSDSPVDGYAPPCDCWKWNSSPLEEQTVVLWTAEPSLQPPSHFLICTELLLFSTFSWFPRVSGSPLSTHPCWILSQQAVWLLSIPNLHHSMPRGRQAPGDLQLTKQKQDEELRTASLSIKLKVWISFTKCTQGNPTSCFVFCFFVFGWLFSWLVVFCPAEKILTLPSPQRPHHAIQPLCCYKPVSILLTTKN